MRPSGANQTEVSSSACVLTPGPAVLADLAERFGVPRSARAQPAGEALPMQGPGRLARVNGERPEAVVGQLELFRALAEENERQQQVGSPTAYTYP
jgi:hypothetical protein